MDDLQEDSTDCQEIISAKDDGSDVESEGEYREDTDGKSDDESGEDEDKNEGRNSDEQEKWEHNESSSEEDQIAQQLTRYKKHFYIFPFSHLLFSALSCIECVISITA